MSNILSLESISSNIFQFCKHLRVRTQAKCLLVTVLEKEEMTQRQILLRKSVQSVTQTHSMEGEAINSGKRVGEIKENFRVKSDTRHRSLPGC